jgi:hypothetical protein
VGNGVVSFANDDLLSQFNEKFKNSRELQKQLDQANQRLASLQAAGMQQSGISKSDLGLK